VYEILKVGGKNPVNVGIGQVSVLDKLRELKPNSVVVFELSSWRLSALGRYKLSPKIGVITNIFPDHLNYYGTMEEYIKDKKFICANQKASDFCVLNWDDSRLQEMEGEIRSQIIKFSEKKHSRGKSVFVHDEAIYLNDGIDERKVLNIAEIKIKGDHNVVNVLASIGAGYAAGVDLASIRKAVLGFIGVPHRLEFVRELNGVKYYNDTAATTPESAISGIKSFNEPIILICGGADKNLDMKLLAKTITDRVKGIVFFKGVATEKLITEMKKILPEGEGTKHFTAVETIEKALELANISAERGDVILLSPGAASFGLFSNEFDRGDKFREAVKRLK
jgi:UDP-N-acetylmuramoylalanine--D-glutamate ligase